MALVFLFFLLNILGEIGLAALVNRTIDDYFGDPITGIFPIYTPQDGWQQGNGCTGCIVRPDSSMAFDGTWHDATFLVGGDTRSVSISFTGSAVYAFFITAPIISGVVSSHLETHLNITLDGNLSGKFDFIPSTSKYGYNQPIYANANLLNGQHTLVISSGGSNSVLEFDYVVYTIDDETTSSAAAPVGTSTGASTNSSTGTSTKMASTASTKLSNPSSAASSQTGTAAVLPGTSTSSAATTVHQQSAIGVIVGGVIGGVVITSITIFLGYFCFYRERNRSTANANDSEAKGQAIPAGPRTPTFTPAEIDPFHISPNQSSFYRITEKQGRSFHIPNQTPKTSDPPQAELNRRMEELQQEMALLQSQTSLSSQHIPSRADETDGWRSNVELLRAEVESLRLMMHTQSSQDLLDPPPPDYVDP